MVHLHQYLQGKEFSFEQILLGAGRMPDFPRGEVDLSSYATRDIKISLPFLSAPMDTVTGYEMAIMLELLGGIGVIHYNFPTIDAQIDQLKKVKNYKAAFVKNPVCLRPDNTVGDVYRIHEERGFYSVPITEDGTADSRLLGFVSHRDVRYEEDRPDKLLKDVMTPREELIVAHRRDTLDQLDVTGIRAANAIIRGNKLDKLVIVGNEDRPCALVTDRDLQLHHQYPNASVDENKQLYGFVAIRGAWHDSNGRELEMERIHKAAEAGANCLIIDQGVVYASQPEIAKYIKKNYPEIQVGVGNVATGELVRELVETCGNYIDMIKVGVGPGGACITQQELGVGRAQPSAVYECAEVLKPLRNKHGNIALVGDGGIKTSADITKLLALGADTVMMGQMFAGVRESPSPVEHKDGQLKKKYRGMGSLEAMEAGSAVRYGAADEQIRIPEGIVKWVDYLGPGEQLVVVLRESVKQSMNKQGFRNIPEMHEHCWIYPDPERC